MTTTTPDDPYGDKAFLEARRRRGREAILGGAMPFEPERRDPRDEGDPDEFEDGSPPPPGDRGGPGGPRDPGAPRLDGVKIPRIVGEDVRWVPISLPDDCPVTPLGVQGGTYWYLNPHGELIGLKSAEHGQSHLAGLFGHRIEWLTFAFPQFNQQGVHKGFQAQYAQFALMGACSVKGVFDARERVRGRGCWKGEDGELIQHLGDKVLVDGREQPPGDIDGFVYVGRPAVPAPMAGGKTAALGLLQDLTTWRWARGDLDARLLLGWIGCMILGGALSWRPMIFITGDAGSGKSTIQERLKAMFGARLASTVDATPAALRGMIGQDSIGVSFDEIEADMLNDQAQMVMKLARVAASGGSVYRMNDKQGTNEFQLRGCFCFSAILPPSMRPQDMQRLAFLRLYPLAKDGKEPPSPTPAEAREIGAQLVGRMTQGWKRWAETLAVYEKALAGVGHNQRGSKQFGTLLAAADLMLEDETPTLDAIEWMAEPLRREGLYEYESSEPNWQKAWRHLLSAQPEAWRSDGFPTVAQVLAKYYRAAERDSVEDMEAANVKLMKAGLAALRDTRGKVWLAVPPRGQAVQAIFASSDFRAHGGDGAWTSALRGAPPWDPGTREGVFKADNVRALQRIRCTLIRVDATLETSSGRSPIFDPGPRQGEDEERLGVELPAAKREPGEDG